jgi:hypothetical protein
MNFLDKIHLSTKTVPFFIFGVSLIAFGVLTFNLGFFQDDWHHINYYIHEGFDGLRYYFFLNSRPYASLVYGFFFALLGTTPSHWHISLMLLRFLTAIVLWANLNILWSGFEKENAFIALLFLIYPAYLLQPVSVSYTLHWAMYFLYMLSILTMFLSFKKPKYFVALTAISLFTQTIQLLMIEYFIGIELLRPIFIWILFKSESAGERIKKAVVAWLPYLAILVLYVFYRLSFTFLLGYDRFNLFPKLALKGTLIHAISNFLQVGLQDFIEILIVSWSNTIDPALFDFSHPSNVLLWSGVLISIMICWAYFSVLKEGNNNPEIQSRWARQILSIGLVAMLLGVLPGWAIGKTVYTSNQLWNDRFAMGAMFGAGMIWVGIIFLLIPNIRHRYLLMSLLLSLAIGLNLQTDINYRRAWEKQIQFYWQLYWRAPQILPRTAFISDGEIFPYMGLSPTSDAINTLYPQTLPHPLADFWFYSGYEGLPKWENFRAGAELTIDRYGPHFSGLSTDSLAILFNPEDQQCLWVLRPEDDRIQWLNPANLEALPVSNINRIQRTPLGGWVPPRNIFGVEPIPNWCYYFERGDLARQYKDWKEVTNLWEEAGKKHLAPSSGIEFIPFIEGFAHTDEWTAAEQLTYKANKMSTRMSPILCAVWTSIEQTTSPSAQRDEAVRIVRSKFSCQR